MWIHRIKIEIQQPGPTPVTLPLLEDQPGKAPVPNEHDARVLLKEALASIREKPLEVDEKREFKRGELRAKVGYVINKAG